MTKHCKYETTAVNTKHCQITLNVTLVNKTAFKFGTVLGDEKLNYKSLSQSFLNKPHIRKHPNQTFHFIHMTKHCKYETTVVNIKHINITLNMSLVNKLHSRRYSIGRRETNLQDS
jgi:hypothetical protein